MIVYLKKEIQNTKKIKLVSISTKGKASSMNAKNATRRCNHPRLLAFGLESEIDLDSDPIPSSYNFLTANGYIETLDFNKFCSKNNLFGGLRMD